jgi:hypothetical protein
MRSSSACTVSSVSISKPVASAGKRFHEAPREHPVARKDVGERASEEPRDETGEEAVAHAMAGAVGGALPVDAAPDHHVELVPGEAGDHLGRARRRVGVVAIDEHVDIGLDVREHPANDLSLALRRHVPHLGAGCPGGLDGCVARVVVEDVDLGARQA